MMNAQYTFNLPHPTGLGELDFKVAVREFNLQDYNLDIDNTDISTLDVDDVATCLFDVEEILFTDVTDFVHTMTNNVTLRGYIENNCWSLVAERALDDYITEGVVSCTTDD